VAATFYIDANNHLIYSPNGFIVNVVSGSGDQYIFLNSQAEIDMENSEGASIIELTCTFAANLLNCVDLSGAQSVFEDISNTLSIGSGTDGPIVLMAVC
jgi:hypothetical protein